MTDWQDRDNGDAVLDGWYAILVSWGTPWEEDTPDVLLFRDGAWVQRQKDCSLPNFYYFQGPFQSSVEARDWGWQVFCRTCRGGTPRPRRPAIQPVPVAPTDEEILKLAAEELCYEFDESWFLTGRNCPDLDTDPCELLNYARAVLARWGRPAIEPVPGVEGADA